MDEKIWTSEKSECTKKTQKLNRFWKCAKNWTDLKMHEKILPILGTNLIDWKKSAAAKNQTQRLGLTQWLRKSIAMVHKIWNAQFFFWKIGNKNWKIGNSEIGKRIWRLNGFWKMFGKSDLIAQAWLRTIIWKEMFWIQLVAIVGKNVSITWC